MSDQSASEEEVDDMDMDEEDNNVSQQDRIEKIDLSFDISTRMEKDGDTRLISDVLGKFDYRAPVGLHYYRVYVGGKHKIPRWHGKGDVGASRWQPSLISALHAFVAWFPVHWITKTKSEYINLFDILSHARIEVGQVSVAHLRQTMEKKEDNPHTYMYELLQATQPKIVVSFSFSKKVVADLFVPPNDALDIALKLEKISLPLADRRAAYHTNVTEACKVGSLRYGVWKYDTSRITKPESQLTIHGPPSTLLQYLDHSHAEVQKNAKLTGRWFVPAAWVDAGNQIHSSWTRDTKLASALVRTLYMWSNLITASVLERSTKSVLEMALLSVMFGEPQSGLWMPLWASYVEPDGGRRSYTTFAAEGTPMIYPTDVDISINSASSSSVELDAVREPRIITGATAVIAGWALFGTAHEERAYVVDRIISAVRMGKGGTYGFPLVFGTPLGGGVVANVVPDQAARLPVVMEKVMSLAFPTGLTCPDYVDIAFPGDILPPNMKAKALFPYWQSHIINHQIAIYNAPQDATEMSAPIVGLSGWTDVELIHMVFLQYFPFAHAPTHRWASGIVTLKEACRRVNDFMRPDYTRGHYLDVHGVFSQAGRALTLVSWMQWLGSAQMGGGLLGDWWKDVTPDSPDAEVNSPVLVLKLLANVTRHVLFYETMGRVGTPYLQLLFNENAAVAAVVKNVVDRLKRALKTPYHEQIDEILVPALQGYGLEMHVDLSVAGDAMDIDAVAITKWPSKRFLPSNWASRQRGRFRRWRPLVERYPLVDITNRKHQPADGPPHPSVFDSGIINKFNPARVWIGLSPENDQNATLKTLVDEMLTQETEELGAIDFVAYDISANQGTPDQLEDNIAIARSALVNPYWRALIRVLQNGRLFERPEGVIKHVLDEFKKNLEENNGDFYAPLSKATDAEERGRIVKRLYTLRDFMLDGHQQGNHVHSVLCGIAVRLAHALVMKIGGTEIYPLFWFCEQLQKDAAKAKVFIEKTKKPSLVSLFQINPMPPIPKQHLKKKSNRHKEEEEEQEIAPPKRAITSVPTKKSHHVAPSNIIRSSSASEPPRRDPQTGVEKEKGPRVSSFFTDARISVNPTPKPKAPTSLPAPQTRPAKAPELTKDITSLPTLPKRQAKTPELPMALPKDPALAEVNLDADAVLVGQGGPVVNLSDMIVPPPPERVDPNVTLYVHWHETPATLGILPSDVYDAAGAVIDDMPMPTAVERQEVLNTAFGSSNPIAIGQLREAMSDDQFFKSIIERQAQESTIRVDRLVRRLIDLLYPVILLTDVIMGSRDHDVLTVRERRTDSPRAPSPHDLSSFLRPELSSSWRSVEAATQNVHETNTMFKSAFNAALSALFGEQFATPGVHRERNLSLAFCLHIEECYIALMDALMTMPNVPMHLAPDLALREWYMTLMRNKLEDEGAQILPDAPTLAPGVPAPVAASKSDTGAIKALIALNKQTWTMMPEQVARELKTSGPGATDLDNLARSTSLQRFWKSASPDAFVALRNTIMAYRTNALNQMDLRSTRNIITSLCKFIAPPKLAAGGTAVPSLSRYMAEQFVLMRQREAWELNAAFLNAVWFTPDALVFRTFENTVAAFSALAWELESSIDDHAAMFGTVAPLIPEDDKKVVTYYGITLGNWARVVQLATKPVTHGLRWLLGHIEQHAAAWQYSTELTQMSGRQLIGQDRNEKWASTLKSLLITDSSQHSILVRTRTVGNEGGFTSNPAALYQSSFEYEFLIRLFIINRETR